MRSTSTFQGVKSAGEEIALRGALRWHAWRPRTRLRLIRLLLSLQSATEQSSEAHHSAA